MSRKIILVGDRTSHGGVVLQGSHSMVIGGKNVALIGDMVSCPQCKGNYPIAEGSSRMRLKQPASYHLLFITHLFS